METMGREQRTTHVDAPNQPSSGTPSFARKTVLVVFGVVVLFALTAAVLLTHRQQGLQIAINDLGVYGIALLVTIAFVVAAIMVYGLAKRTLWDLLQLLIVPLALAGIGLWFTTQQDVRQQDIENQRAQDTALQAYLDQMSVLLIEKDLRASDRGSEVRTLARARTLAVLEQLDPSRKTQVMQFLMEARLVQGELEPNDKGEAVLKRGPIISLGNANLSGADLSATIPDTPVGVGSSLYPVELEGAELSFAEMSGVDLSRAFLSHASLVGANLSCADLKSEKCEGNKVQSLLPRASKLQASRCHYAQRTDV